MIRKVLVGIGGTPFSSVAIERAIELAKAHDARLTAVTVSDPNRICSLGPVPPGAGIYAKRMCDNRLAVTQKQLEKSVTDFEQACRLAGVAGEVAWETGSSFDLLSSLARYHDLTVFGLRSLFDYQLVDEPEKDLIRLLSSGVRPILAVSSQMRTIRRVMVAYSGSMESAKAMRRFVQFRLWPQAEMSIVHLSGGTGDGNNLLKDAAAYCGDHGYAVKTLMVPGSAADKLLSVAREMNADLIVMGNSIRSIWLRKVLGDSLLKTLTNSDRPLFLSQ
jgi:nucleotide-binding universal stress UspA family protein